MLFLKTDWKRIALLSIFLFSFETTLSLPTFGDTISSPTDTLNRINKNRGFDSSVATLADALLKTENERREFIRYNIFLADIASGNINTEINQRYINCIVDLEENSRHGLYLIQRIFDTCRYLEGKIDEMSLPYEEKLSIKMRLEELIRDAQKFGLTLKKQSASTADKSIVLEVNKDLGVIIIGSGSLDNSYAGTEWSIPDADNSLIKIVAVRPYASAAVVIKGDFNRVSQGMKAIKLNKQ